MMKKLGLHTTIELAKYAVERHYSYLRRQIRTAAN